MIKRYGFLGSIRLMISLLYTKLLFRKSRLIRLPFDIRNRKHIDLGENLTTGFGCRIEAYPQDDTVGLIVKFGKNVEINDYVHISGGGEIIIGNDVLIASRVFISDINHGQYKGEVQDSPLTKPNCRMLSTNRIVIKDNVWIGENVCIMSGVSIGQGSIIGAMSVVTKDIPEFSIAVGSPAIVVKKYDFEVKEWRSVKNA